MPGPPPKDPRLRARRNRATTAAKVQAGARRKGSPSLPKRRGGWHARTVAWWRDLWRSELATRLLQVDYYPLLRLAELYDHVNERGAAAALEVSKEARILESRWGLDEMSRRSLQIEIVRPGTKDAAEPAPTEEVVDPRTVLRAVK